MSTIVIKIGGGKGIDPLALMDEVACLVSRGERVVVVHGGSHETNELAEALGHPPRTIQSSGGRVSRRTDRRTLEIFEMVYCGKINKAVVERLRHLGTNAIGLSGIDAGIWVGKRKTAIRDLSSGTPMIIRDDLSGRVEQVNGHLLNTLLDAGMVPVLTPPAVTSDGVAINVDADRAAAATAGALNADELLLLSNVRGVLESVEDSRSLIQSVSSENQEAVQRAAMGRMKNKVLAAEEAIGMGVARVVIGSAAGEYAIERARRGEGTAFEQQSHDVPGAEVSTEAERVLIDLVAAPSVSYSEDEAVRVFAGHAERLGLRCEVDSMGSAIAHIGADPNECRVHIMLLGHIDTVSGDIPVCIEDGILYGRGSVDAKGPLAAMLVAASEAELPEGVCLSVAGAVGEETAESRGAKAIATEYSPDACIIGEPSGADGVTIGYKGRLLVEATFESECFHSAGEQDNACDLAHRWWCSISERVGELNLGKQRVFEQVQSRLLSQQSEADGNMERTRMSASFRLPLAVVPDRLETELRKLLPENGRLVRVGSETAYATDRNDPVVRALITAIRAEGHSPKPKLKTGTADFNVVGPIWNCPIAAYGPGDSQLDHTPREHIVLAEYTSSIRVLKHAIEGIAQEMLSASQDGVNDLVNAM
ncbi:MAG: hypothetical protein Phyf2KO_07250 [Phycisphaerales bacterium]